MKPDILVLGASDGPGSRKPSPAVSALTGFDPSRIAELRDLDAERNNVNRTCPVRNGKRLLPDGACPRCRATSSQGCGPADNVEYRIAECVRRAFRDSDGSGEAGETGTGSTVGDSAGRHGIALSGAAQ
jgi:hypothetical protein